MKRITERNSRQRQTAFWTGRKLENVIRNQLNIILEEKKVTCKFVLAMFGSSCSLSFCLHELPFPVSFPVVLMYAQIA